MTLPFAKLGGGMNTFSQTYPGKSPMGPYTLSPAVSRPQIGELERFSGSHLIATILSWYPKISLPDEDILGRKRVLYRLKSGRQKAILRSQINVSLYAAIKSLLERKCGKS